MNGRCRGVGGAATDSAVRPWCRSNGPWRGECCEQQRCGRNNGCWPHLGDVLHQWNGELCGRRTGADIFFAPHVVPTWSGPPEDGELPFADGPVSRRAKFGIALIASIVGCGGRIGTATDDAGGSSKEAGNYPEDGASVRRLDGGSPPLLDATSFDGDAPSPISWDGRAPEDHRASATDCPQQRDEDAGTACAASWPPDPGEYACAQDSDCTMGAN